MTPPTDISEKGLESLIVANLTGQVTPQSAASGLGISDGHGEYRVGDYVQGDAADFDRDHALDLAKLLDFLRVTQPEVVEQFALEEDGPPRGQFLARLQGEIAKRGVIDVLRKGIKHHSAEIRLFYGMPTPGNTKAAEQYAANIFSVTRQLRYSKDETRLALDLALFINGLPVATFELKNNLTKQTYQDAITQYKQDRDPRETLFKFGVCAVHFALDDQQVWMCTALQGQQSWFIPFNKGYHDGAGNPPNPDGLKTDYLWKEVLARDSLTNILENYAQIVEEKDAQGKKKRRQVFPRYHQLDVVRNLLADARANGAGRRYLIQHSAGSGKSNSIAWLAHQLVPLKRAGAPVFDSVIVVTDRRVLDKQIRDTIRQFAQVSSVVGAAEHSGDLRRFLQSGKKIVITTVQKFPIILNDIGDQHRGQRFAIIIDEAHSSQGGRTSAKMNEALSPIDTTDQDEDTEDRINRLIASKKMLPNASYFAFTATPKNKTLELFGERVTVDGAVMPRPFHVYSMKQAIQEGFILDVLQNYTPVSSYYRLIKKVEEDPEFDTNRAQKKLRHYVESHQYAIRQKAEIMVDHFHEQVARKIGGQVRAMVVTNGIDRAIQYFHAFDAYLRERKSPYRAIVAFSGEHQDGGIPVTEASLNGFPSANIPDQFIEEPYRFLIVADKFQTGYDEPLLHTMYVDKQLSDIKAVQTLSRLNRSCPEKHDTFVLDFLNDPDIIQHAFDRYYRTTILSGETDPNKLHDLKADLDGYQVYAWDDVESLVQRYLAGANRDQLDPILDGCVAVYREQLDEDGQIDFKSKAKAFLRAYNFLGTILPFNTVEWEELSIFLNFLVPKLPAPRDDDLSVGILETIDMDSYRVEVKAAMAITLLDDDTVIDPIPTSAGGFAVEAELDRLSNIVKAFNDQFGNIEWKNRDKIEQVITEELPAKVAADQAYQNAIAHSDKQNARIEHDRALQKAIIDLVWDHSELYKWFEGDTGFKKWLSDTNFALTYQPSDGSSS
jgi:type I restriction enzyme R subunit